MKTINQKISKNSIKTALILYNHALGWKASYELLISFCKQYPDHNCIPIVQIKVSLINKLFSTSLIAERKWAKNIGNIQNLKTLLDKGNSLAVEKIASCLNKDTFWVFATKYCHFHNPKDFPIFDQYTEKALGYTYTDRTKPVSKWYNSYRLSVQGAINSTEENYSFFQMDCFLWLKGQKMMIQKNDNKKNTLSREIQFSMKEHQELWQQL